MEKYTMFMDQKNQYSGNEYTTQSNLQIQCTPYQTTSDVFQRTNNFTICMELQKTSNSQSNLGKKNGTGGINLPDFRLYQKATVIKTVLYWHKDRNIYQWNKIESPGTNPRTYGHLIFDKGGKNIQWRKDNLFNKWCWENWLTTCKRMKLEHFLTPYIKISSKWIKNLNIRPETIKLLQEKIDKTLSDLNHSRILYDPPPRIMEIKAKINQWDLNKLKNFCTTKETISKVKSRLQNGRK